MHDGCARRLGFITEAFEAKVLREFKVKSNVERKLCSGYLLYWLKG